MSKKPAKPKEEPKEAPPAVDQVPASDRERIAAETPATAHGVVKYLALVHGLTFDEACMTLIQNSKPLLDGIKGKASVKDTAEAYLDRP